MKPLLLLLLLSGSALAQGVPVAPRAPAFNPVTDSPITTGQPGYIGRPERAPRGTDKRVLPPTREPGIWAADKPKASGPPVRNKGEPIPVIGLLGFSVPVSEHASDALDTRPSEICADAASVNLARDDMSLMLRALALPLKQRECLAALAQYQCLQWLERDASAAGMLPPESRALAMMVYAVEATMTWVERACMHDPESAEVASILGALAQSMTTGKAPPWRH